MGLGLGLPPVMPHLHEEEIHTMKRMKELGNITMPNMKGIEKEKYENERTRVNHDVRMKKGGISCREVKCGEGV